MSPDDVRAARESLGLSQFQMADMLGYEGTQRGQQVHDLETGKKPLRECQRRLILAYLEGYRPNDWPLGFTSRVWVVTWKSGMDTGQDEYYADSATEAAAHFERDFPARHIVAVTRSFLGE